VRNFVASIIGSFLLASCSPPSGAQEYRAPENIVTELNERFAGPSGLFHDPSYPEFLADYSATGDYLNWGKIRAFRSDGEIVIHESGLPQVLQDGKPYWNTVTLSHFALTEYGRHLNGDAKALPMLRLAVRKLVELQRFDGGFPYPSRPHRDHTLPDGWVSAMAQGNALSAFTRYLAVEKDDSVERAAGRAFDNLMTPVQDGGASTTMADLDASLSGFVFFPEYPAEPVDYTLNGYMFALLGVYDWSQVDSPSQARAKEAFASGIRTLDRILPLYDIDGFSTYDLAHIVLDAYPSVHPDYLGIHVYLLHALHSVTGNALFKNYETKWAAKIDAMNAKLRITGIEAPAEFSVGAPAKIRLRASGPGAEPTLYQLSVKSGNEWTVVQLYSPSDTLEWTPPASGDYVLGFFARSDDGSDWYNFRYRRVTVR